MIKNFDQYSIRYSKDPNKFLNQVNVAVGESFSHSYFNVISNSHDLSESNADFPMILTDSFVFEYNSINESSVFKYNYRDLPSKDSIYEYFLGLGYSPKSVSNIKDIKKLKFPIEASNSKGTDLYKTIGKLKNCESIYKSFKESPEAKTQFKILSFKGNPISIVEKINKFPIDVDLNSFKYLEECQNISEAAYNEFGIDICNISIIESLNEKIYVKSIDKKFDFNPHQAKIVYESVYEDFYQTRLPNFVKHMILEKNVAPYYKQKYYDSKLIKSNHSMDYSKHI